MRSLSFFGSCAAAILAVSLSANPARAGLTDYTQLFVFGDSLSDSGNAYNLSSGLFPPDPPYYQGRFSNGPNWIDRLGDSLDLNPVLSTDPGLNPAALPSDGINFAIGAATSGDTTIAHIPTGNPDLESLPGLTQQIEAFQALYSGPVTPDPDALFVLWIGGNDYLFNIDGPATVLGNIASAITTLSSLGAENFLIANLPDLGETPFAELLGVPGAEEALNTVTAAHNLALEALLASLDGNFSLLDINALFKEAIADPDAFGFTDTENSFLLECFDGGIFVCSPDAFIYWDEVHATAAAHRFIAARALETLAIPEPSTLALMSVGLLGVGFTTRHRRARWRLRSAG